MFQNNAAPTTKDWFEFILDLNLLDNHFKLNDSNNGI